MDIRCLVNGNYLAPSDWVNSLGSFESALIPITNKDPGQKVNPVAHVNKIELILACN